VGDSELALYRAVSVDSGRLNWVQVDIVISVLVSYTMIANGFGTSIGPDAPRP
jgi:hypothetical protein